MRNAKILLTFFFLVLQIHHCKIDLPRQDLSKVKIKQRAGHQARQAGQVQTRRQTGMLGGFSVRFLLEWPWQAF